ncbi:transcription factor bHLH121 isoform X2 [Amborella trichopoda]|uniref:transcription factor bHLH121 isoform X2 n=1 Tax=Amborella trichopoda TaxID=13333 RepID=UPI0009BD9E81|nr:transcription factor bHLH121 isoform X2 [Amborella trichopoda]|eukprot:XP_020532147.1 transcription factor bHLH121 isoform X2 [Amborella trichopoda]
MLHSIQVWDLVSPFLNFGTRYNIVIPLSPLSLMEPLSHSIHQGLVPDLQPPSDGFHLLETGHPDTRYGRRVEANDPTTARKVQKADREKLRRDRLNEQFLELGSALDPDRPKNDKATILTDAVQMLKDLTAEVNRLKAENLMLEKNELKDEKATLRSDVESLRIQYQQRIAVMFPWAPMDPTVAMGPTPYPFPMPTLATPDSQRTPTQGHAQASMTPFMPVPFHPSIQPFPFFRSVDPSGNNQYLSLTPYASTVNVHSHVERPSAQYPSPVPPLPGFVLQLQPTISVPDPRSLTPSMPVANHETLGFQQGSIATELSPCESAKKCEDLHSSMGADLELRTPTSSSRDSTCQSKCSRSDSQETGENQECSIKTKKTKQSSDSSAAAGSACPGKCLDDALSVNLGNSSSSESCDGSPSNKECAVQT